MCVVSKLPAHPQTVSSRAPKDLLLLGRFCCPFSRLPQIFSPRLCLEAFSVFFHVHKVHYNALSGKFRPKHAL